MTELRGRSVALAGCVGLVALLSRPAHAHDIWATVDRAPDGTQMIADIGFGDRDDRAMPDPVRIVELDVIGPSGTTDLRRPLKATARQGQPVLETRAFPISPGSIIAIIYDNGFWAKKPGDKNPTNTSPLLAPDGTDLHWTVKYSKMLYGQNAYKKVLNQRLEITALKDPFTLNKGDMLPVQVAYEGKPVAGIEVNYGDGVTPVPDAKLPRVKTGTDGIANVPLDRLGPYLIVVDANEPPADKRFATYDHVFSSISFDLAK